MKKQHVIDFVYDVVVIAVGILFYDFIHGLLP